MSAALLVIGDALLDRDVEGHSERLCPDAPVPVVDQDASRLRPGGAGLAATLAAAGGCEITFVTALADDAAGAALSRALLASGVDVIDLGLSGATPEKIRILSDGEALLRLDRGGGGAVLAEGAERRLKGALAGADGILVSDYGHGVAAAPGVRKALRSRPAGAPLVWDPHPRGGRPIEGAELITPNLAEARGFAPLPRVSSGNGRGSAADLAPAGGEDEARRLARALAAEWRAATVCVTRGAAPVVYAGADGGGSIACEPADGDPCGAGDRFASELAAALADGADRVTAIAAAAAAASEFVAAGGARAIAAPQPAATVAGTSATAPSSRFLPDSGSKGELAAAPFSLAAALQAAERVRRRGGTVVATGGCFDLLHVGHARTLEAARRLGDCLIVLLNGDRSVSELKGAERPLVGELERAAMLKTLGCVDEVAIFDEADPREALRALRPAVWAKGGDYELEQLPERRLVSSWGGRVAILPYLEGRSTTGLIEEVGQRAA